ncbi:MAG: hypothetical protein GXO69_03325 [Acidobacteria bacterium]|nr:hypothetical protein [Acidobacteriota bacterium]
MKYLAEFAAGTIGTVFYKFAMMIEDVLLFLGLDGSWSLIIAEMCFGIVVLGEIIFAVHYYRKKRYYIGTLFLIIAFYIIFGVISFGYFSMNK